MMFLAGIIPLFLILACIIPLSWLLWRAAVARLLPPLPATAPRGAYAARTAEALTILVVGLLLLVLQVFHYSYQNFVQLLERLSPPLYAAMIAATIAAPLIVLVASLLALRGRSTWALVLATITVFAYMIFRDEVPRTTFGYREPPKATLQAPYTISTVGEDIPGARLWVNGVDLGTLPYRGTVAEFLAKVPRWDKPPADYKTDTTDHIAYPLSGEPTTVHDRRWITFPSSRFPDSSGKVPPHITGAAPDTYYVRVQHAGEWALSAGSAGSSGRGESYSSSFSIKLPQRDQRLATLLNIARANDYHVDAAWLVAAESFHKDALNAVLSAREKEPGMQQVWDAWARAKYPVDSATSPDAAWALFQRIAADADAAGSYNTLTSQGHALELIASRLPTDRLLSAAKKLLAQVHGQYGYSYDTRYGALAFGTINSGYNSIQGSFGGSSDTAPPSAIVTAHAIFAFHQAQLQAGIYPTFVQQHIVPDILRLGPDWDNTLRVAAHLGGPVAADYIIRQCAQRSSDFRNVMDVNTNRVNKWLYLVSQMQDPDAVAFRRRHPDELLALATQLTPTFEGKLGDDVDFLFEGPALGARFWPQFFAKLQHVNFGTMLLTEFQYLARINAQPAMFLEAWHHLASNDRTNPADALAELAHMSAPALRQAVIDAFRTADIPPQFVQWGYRDEAAARRAVNAALDAAEHPEIDTAALRRLADIHALKLPQDLERLSHWLKSEDAPVRLPELLALDADVRLRFLAAQSLAQLPTPSRRDLLNKLTHDPDAATQQAAQQALQDLAALRTSPPPTSEPNP